MKICRVFVAFVVLLAISRIFAGTEISNETVVARDREPLFRTQLWRALQLRSAWEAAESVYFRWTRSGLDRQPFEYSGRAGPGFYVQHSNCRRRFLQSERKLEDRHRRSLSASLQWRADRSEPEFESSWSTSWSQLLLLMVCLHRITSISVGEAASFPSVRNTRR